MTDQLHVFEKAQLGKAPFYCIGMAEIPSPSLAAHNPEAYNNALRLLPQGIGCGSCAYCGTGIKYNYIIKSSAGNTFVVGAECVAKTGDAGLISTVKAERKRIATEKRIAKREAGFAARKAQWEAERLARAEDFKTLNAELIARATAIGAMEFKGWFIADVLMGGLEGRYVSDKALAAVTEAVTREELLIQYRKNSRHIGTVGKRQVFEVTVERVYPFAGSYGVTYIVSMRDAAGNAVVSMSGAFNPKVGENLRIKATVKEHTVYKGEHQTKVQRVAAA